MYFKLLSTVVVAFWLVTTGLLIQMIYFPEESQFSEVPPSQVINLFLGRGEPEDMDIFSGNRRVGKLRVVPRLKDKQSGRIRLLMKGDIDVDIGGVKGKIDLLSDLWMWREGEMDSFSLELGMKELGVTCKFSQDQDDETVHYLVKRGDTVMLDSDSANATLDNQLQAQILMRAFGFDMSKIQQQVKSEASDPESLKMIARRGMINVEGTRLKGYILVVKALGDAEIKFFFSEVGELLKMDSFLDYRLVNYQLRVDPEGETEDVVFPVKEGTLPIAPETEAGKEDAMIRTEDLSMQYGKLKALNGLNLEIEQGEFFAFLGPNAAGKTTTIKLLTGLLRPTRGQAWICGHNIQEDPIAAKKILGFVPDVALFYDKLTALEFMRFIADIFSLEYGRASKLTGTLFDQFALESYRHELIENLSHGTRQRLAIAAALLHEPKVIIIDEPMIGLDPVHSKIVKDELKRRANEGVTIFMSTHLLNIAQDLADRIGIINHGKLVALGTMDELKSGRTDAGTDQLEAIFLEMLEGTAPNDQLVDQGAGA